MKLALAIAFLVGVVACSEKRVERYTVNGKIVALAADSIDIHHEAIPTYKHRDGKVKGMESMVMGFAPVAKDLPAVAPGDLVRVTFSVHWDSKPGLRIEAMEKLPPETKLVLE